MKVSLFLLPFLLASCAQPKYLDESNSGAQSGSGQINQSCFSSDLCLEMKWDSVPTEEEYGSFQFQFHPRGSSSFIDPTLAPFVLLWMPSMGHGSSPVEVERLGIGSYRAKRVFFTMKGEWEIRFQLREGTSVREELILSFRF